MLDALVPHTLNSQLCTLASSLHQSVKHKVVPFSASGGFVPMLVGIIEVGGVSACVLFNPVV